MVFGSVFFAACRKDNAVSRVPYVYVNAVIYPNSLDFIPISGSIYVNNYGNRGIVVYRMEADVFFAYDRTCPYDPENPLARVVLEPSGISVKDPVCGSKFLLTDGFPYEGPSKSPLLQYRTTYNGEQLYISN